MNTASLTARLGDRAAILVAGFCASLLPLSIIEAGWAPDSLAPLAACLLGLLCGALTAAARPGRRAGWFWAALLGLTLAALAAGLVNPSWLFSEPSRLRLGASLVRVAAWCNDLARGQAVSDPAFVTLWVTLWTWWVGYSAAHGIASGAWALDAMLPALLSLAIHSIYARRNLSYTLIAVFGVIVLMAWTALGKRQAGWNQRGVDYSTELWPEWIGSGAVAAGAACVFALALSTLMAQASVEWLRHAFEQPVTQIRRMADLWLGGADLRPDVSGFENVSGLPASLLISRPPPLDQDVIMWVWTDETPWLPDSVAPPAYGRAGWRGMTYATYTGRAWHNPGLTSRPLALIEAQAGGEWLKQRFELVASHGDTLFAVNEPVAGSAGLAAWYDPSGNLAGLRGDVAQYTIVSRVSAANVEALRASPSVYPPDWGLYLQLPAGLPERVRNLALKITAGAAGPFDKALKIEAFLRTYPYRLDAPPPPPDRDLVDYFLFDAPGGHCTYYASAMAVMLRAVGVPARLASGYVRGAFDAERGAYRVIAADAHAWPEAYLAGIGWVEFEPTAGRPAVARVKGAPDSAGLSAAQVRAELAWRNRLTLLGWLAGGASLLAAGAAARALRRERHMADLPAAQIIPLLYHRLRQLAAWLGAEVHPSDTPDEFLVKFNQAAQRAATPRRQPDAELARRAAEYIVQLYRDASYSSHEPAAAKAQQALETWRILRERVWLLKIALVQAHFRTSGK